MKNSNLWVQTLFRTWHSALTQFFDDVTYHSIWMASLVDFERLDPASPVSEAHNDGTWKCRVYFNVTSMTPLEISGERMWSTYMKTFDEYDKRITNAWKEDANGLLVFVSHIVITYASC
jgi:hypothetical protein